MINKKDVDYWFKVSLIQIITKKEFLISFDKKKRLKKEITNLLFWQSINCQ